jgi:hypothetical protein
LSWFAYLKWHLADMYLLSMALWSWEGSFGYAAPDLEGKSESMQIS